MASVNNDSDKNQSGEKETKEQGPTPARKQLDLVMGKDRVYLDQLSAEEFDEFFREILEKVDLRELRGFKPLRELLLFHDKTKGIFTRGIECMFLQEDVNLDSSKFGESSSVDLGTHVLHLGNGVWFDEIVYKQLETGEETTDCEVASSWGASSYNHRGKRVILVLRRPRNHTGAQDNLVWVECPYEKVPLKNRHVIKSATAEPLPIGNFREVFGSQLNSSGQSPEV